MFNDPPTEIPYWRKLNPARPLSFWERSILERLLSQSFPGRDRVKAQVRTARVSEEATSNSSIMLCVSADTLPILDAKGNLAIGVIPMELVGTDVDGVSIGVVLDTRAGYIDFLDVHRYDGETFKALPNPAELEVRRG